MKNPDVQAVKKIRERRKRYRQGRELTPEALGARIGLLEQRFSQLERHQEIRNPTRDLSQPYPGEQPDSPEGLEAEGLTPGTATDSPEGLEDEGLTPGTATL